MDTVRRIEEEAAKVGVRPYRLLRGVEADGAGVRSSSVGSRTDGSCTGSVGAVL